MGDKAELELEDFGISQSPSWAPERRGPHPFQKEESSWLLMMLKRPILLEAQKTYARQERQKAIIRTAHNTRTCTVKALAKIKFH